MSNTTGTPPMTGAAEVGVNVSVKVGMGGVSVGGVVGARVAVGGRLSGALPPAELAWVEGGRGRVAVGVDDAGAMNASSSSPPPAVVNAGLVIVVPDVDRPAELETSIASAA